MVFPAVSLVDSFKRPNEHPMVAGWLVLPGLPEVGQVHEEAYRSNHNNEEPVGGYWSATPYVNPAVCARLSKGGWNAGHGPVLWACLQNPSTERTGYELWLEGNGGEEANWKIQKVVAGTPTTLATFPAVTIKEGDLFGLTASGGVLIAWRKKAAGEWEEIGETSDATWTEGYIGVGLHGLGRMQNFEAGEVGEGTPAPTVEKPADQVWTEGVPITPLNIVATDTTKYSWLVKPGGLEINESTGEITGTPLFAEGPYKGEITVEGPGGTASVEFEWEVVVGPGPPILEEPGTLENFVGEEVNRELEHHHAITSWVVTGLPKGLTFNEETGKFEGTLTTAEETTVKVTAIGPEGEDTIEFLWIITEAIVKLEASLSLAGKVTPPTAGTNVQTLIV